MAGRIDLINIGLIIISLIMAVYLPFQLFLWAYAILGPLHYVTEINWLEKKNFFIKDRRHVWLLVGVAALIVLPQVLNLWPYFSEGGDGFFQKVHFHLWKNSAPIVLTAIFLAAAMIFSSKLWVVLTAAVSGFGLGLILNTNSMFVLIVGVFVASIIHVYLFTMLFMIFGVLKKPGTWGWVSILALIFAPLVVVGMDVDHSKYVVSEETMATMDSVGMNQLKLLMAYGLGILEKTESFAQMSVLGVKLQIFIAFAYTYHYFNWFSKTTVIGWHKLIDRKKLIILGGIWVVSVGVYLYDYVLGFTLLITLSFLHVVLEFPLNVVSATSIAKSLFSKKS